MFHSQRRPEPEILSAPGALHGGRVAVNIFENGSVRLEPSEPKPNA